MTFTDNHDKNSWEGNQFSNFGDALPTCIVFCGVVSGMPLLYGGQEAGLDRSLAFFEKDEIVWKEHPNNELFKSIFKLKHQNKALWNGAWGGDMIKINNDKPNEIVSFSREKGDNLIIPIINFSNKSVKVQLNTKYYKGNYIDWFTGKSIELKGDDFFEMKPWEYIVLVK